MQPSSGKPARKCILGEIVSAVILLTAMRGYMAFNSVFTPGGELRLLIPDLAGKLWHA